MAHGGIYHDKLDFSANINPLGSHPAVQTVLSSVLRDKSLLERYPDSSCSELSGLLAQFWHVEAPAARDEPDTASGADCIVCASGAADVIYALVHAFAPLSASHAVCILEPAFSEYARAAESCGCEVRHIEQLLDEHTAGVLDGVALLFAASPANPTGKMLSCAELCALASFCEQKNVVFVLDTCFAQFSQAAEASVRGFIARRAEFPHAVVVQAFTKFYGVPGVRLGYALCFSKETAARLQSVLRPWAVGALEQQVGIGIVRAELFDVSWKERTRALVSAERARLVGSLESFGCKVSDGCANFILFHTARVSLPRLLLERGIAIRSCADFYGLDEHWCRIAVRTPEENTRFIAVMQSLQGEL